MVNEPVHQAVKQEQAPAPTIDLLVHIVKPLSFYQKPEDFVPQKQLPKTYNQTCYKRKFGKEKEKEKGGYQSDYSIPVFVLLKARSAHSG